MVDKSSFGYKIRCLRKNRGYSQDELADLLGISTSTLARYENNQTLPGCDVVIRLAIVLSISSDMEINEPDKGNEHVNLFTKGVTISEEEAKELIEKAISEL